MEWVMYVRLQYGCYTFLSLWNLVQEIYSENSLVIVLKQVAMSFILLLPQATNYLLFYVL